MPNSEAHTLLSFPPRPIGPAERTLLDEWLGRAGDIPLAYVSERRSDDPRLYRRIVIAADSARQLAYAVHAPSTGTAWLVASTGQPSRAEIYETLRDALNSIRAVLI
jgi:hypothetical protein